MNHVDYLITGIGLIGAVAILTTFVANMGGRMSPTSKTYLVLNLLGGALVAFNSIWFDAYPAFVINVVWVSASVWGLWRLYTRTAAGDRAV